MSVVALPESVRDLFPKEQLDLASSITSDEKPTLHEVFQKHCCFDECGEIINEVSKKNPSLGKRLESVLECNKKRLQGLSPQAAEFAKEIICMVTNTLCSLTVGKSISDEEAKRLHSKFQTLSDSDKAALRANNPDIKF